MIVTDFNISCGPILKAKDNSKLIVDADRPKTASITFQTFKTITWRTFQFFYSFHGIQKQQLPVGFGVQINGEGSPSTFGVFNMKDIFGALIRKTLNHLSPPLYQYMIQRYSANKKLGGLKVAYFLTCFLIPLGGCVSRAPTDCELDKRAGNYPSSFCDKGAAQTNLPNSIQSQGNTGPKKPMTIPVREAPLVKKIWVPDQILEGGHWMQGTWLFVEVEPSKWVGAVSSGSLSENSVSLNSGSENTLGSKINRVKSTAMTLPSEATKPATPAKATGGAQ
jgi:hypothetical protein